MSAVKALVSFCFLIFMVSPIQAEESAARDVKTMGTDAEVIPGTKNARELETGDWRFGTYLDLGYTINFNHPENGLWRSKGTTFRVDDLRVNMAMGYLKKDATPQSRWGMEFGLQTGVDTEKLVPEPPPKANEPISNADLYRHLARANVSFLFPVGKGLMGNGGLINSYIGYESYFAMENSNYTRAYMTDNLPYFFFGVGASYPLKDTLNLALYAVNGWNYLANPNDHPSFGLQLLWKASPQAMFTQNLYYGPDQENTDLEFWRFFSDSILEWKSAPFTLAISFDVGTEKQAEQFGNPRGYWMAGALWAAWNIDRSWTLTVRPEFFYDPDGIITGAIQTLQAYTATLKYKFSPIASNTVVANIEYRYDRSTGPGGGFFKGSDNILDPDQQLLIFALTWHFGR